MTRTADMQEGAVAVPINDLPRHFPGATVLQRCFHRVETRRDISAVKAEYGADKYDALLEILRRADGQPIEPFELRMAEFRRSPEASWCFSVGEDLFYAPLASVQARFDRLLVEEVVDKAETCRTIVELGCGYGYNLGLLAPEDPTKYYIGGDLAATAVAVADALFGERGPRVRPFDYYDEAYDLLEHAEGPVLVFTRHSIEQLPAAGQVIETLGRYADKIAAVLHFEPVYEGFGDTLLGRLRAAHAESLDYNRDLLGELERRDNIEIESARFNVFGINPLNPTSIVEWRFA